MTTPAALSEAGDLFAATLVVAVLEWRFMLVAGCLLTRALMRAAGNSHPTTGLSPTPGARENPGAY